MAKALASALIMLVSLAQPAIYAQSPEIRVEGGSEALQENIRAHLNIEEERCNSQLRRLNRLLPQVRRNVERAAQALGYYQLQQQAEFSTSELCWQLQITVMPGERARFGNINLALTSGDTRLFRTAIEEIPVRQGEPLNHSEYERLKSTLSSVAVENGYFSARFIRSELRVDVAQNTADVNIEFDPGERFSFGELQISQMDALSERFISRFIPFDEGEPYSTDQLISLRENFNESQYFDQVSVTPQLQQAQNQQIPVTIELTPRMRHSYTAGAGVSTDSGPRVRLGYENRYLNRRGHRLNADVAISKVQQEPNISYIIPLQNPAHDSLRFTAGYIGEENDSYESDTYRVGATWRTRLFEDWVQNIFVNYQREDFIIDALPEQTNLMITGINLSRTSADDPIFPTRGWRLFGQVSGASDSLLSDLSFIQLYGSAKLIQTVGPLRFLLRAEAATTFVDELLELPASQRFFTGGDQSVRGYEYETLGELNDNGEVIGGKHLLVTSAEMDFSVRPGWRGAVFYDRGNSFANFDDMNLKQSAGIGLRWLSPIGPIRVDVARALDDQAWRLHITMGPDL